MAIRSDKKRVMITLSEQLLNNLDSYCEKLGVSRSAYITTCVANQLYAQDKVIEALGPALAQLVENAQE